MATTQKVDYEAVGELKEAQIQAVKSAGFAARAGYLVGSLVIFLVTLAALSIFLFFPESKNYEDAVRILLLMIGSILGAMFGPLSKK